MSTIKYMVLILTILLISTTTFAAEYTVPRAACSVYAEDLDLDGDKDIVVGHKTGWEHYNPTISILKNEGNGTFTIFDTSLVFCGYQHNIFAQNIDNDNYPDIVAFGADHSSAIADRYIRIFYNENGYFTEFTDFSLNSDATFSYITYGDIDNDDDMDIIVCSNNGFFWGYLLNNGSGEFSLPIYYDLSFPPGGIACGNLNEDNRNDVVVSGHETGIYFSYESGFVFYLLGDYELRVGIADMDNDGDNDIVGLRQIWDIIGLTIYENLGENNFYEHEQTFYEIFTSSFVISDLDNDGFPDIVCPDISPDGGIYILYNEGDFNLSEPQYFYVANYGEPIRKSFCADLDGNDFNDIITIRYSHSILPSNLNILFNDGNGNFVEDPQIGVDEEFLLKPEITVTNYPNPFNPNTNICFQLSETDKINLSIYNIKGALIKKLINDKIFSKGIHSIKWSGRNNKGEEVSSNVYIYRLRVGDKSISKKMLLVR